MCGIAGALYRSRKGVPDDVIGRMAERLRHRGPDHRSTFRSSSGRCLLGHARLSVLDLETGDQPMSNEDGSIWVVFNGEIYNFREIRDELESRGHVFRTRSDTETIVHGYEQWGDAVAEHLDGMFAFGVWDEPRQRLLLARDRPGKKPLFVYEDPDKILFASELKALLEHPAVDDRIDPTAFSLYLAYGYVPSPGTFYRRIRKLAAASTLCVEASGSVRESSYWDLEFAPKRVSMEDAAEQLRSAMKTAVARRMVADVPLGAFLSGGVDSTLVVGLMSQLGGRVKTFSIGFENDPVFDETGYARLAAKRFATDHTEFLLEPRSIDLVERLVEAYDEPFGDSSAIPTYVVSELTRRHVTVALTGDGGDEMFAGYLRFYGAVLAEHTPRLLLRAAHGLARRLPHDDNARSWSRRATRFTAAAALPLGERMLRWIGFFAEDVEGMVRPEVVPPMGRSELLRGFDEPLHRMESDTPLSRVLYMNFRTYLLDDLLPKADRCSMAHGLELRSPLLDTRVMELAASMPSRLKLRAGTTKFILRHAFRDLLPPQILGRPKMGFGIPLAKWFREDWREIVEDYLLSPRARLLHWLRPEPIARIAEEHFSGRADFGHQLWALLTLEVWLRKGRFSEGA